MSGSVTRQDMSRSIRLQLAFTIIAAALVASVLGAQERTSAISGVVTDQSGGAVAGAAVRVLNTGTGQGRTLATNEQGAYRAVSLELGIYEVTAEKQGFRTSIHKGVLLELDREAVVDHVLPLGEIAETIVVENSGRTVAAVPSAVTDLVSQEAISELPLNGRGIYQLATLQAGTVISRNQSRDVNVGYGVQLSIAGSRPFQNSFRLDGVTLNSFNNATPAGINGVSLGVDAMQEFSVHSSAYSAQYGRAGGGIINAVTRSGSNDFHGTAFYFHRNDNLDARNFFDGADKPEFRRHQLGASLGGPIKRNRAFFFTNAETLRQARGNTTINTTPSAAARRGELTSGGVTVDPVMAKIADLYPLPNGAVFGDSGLFIFPNDEVADQNFVTGRFDLNPGDFDRLFTRYSIDDAALSDETDFALGTRESTTRMQSLAVEETHIFSPALLNTARFGLMLNEWVGGATQTQVPGTDDPALEFVPGSGVMGLILVTGIDDVSRRQWRPRSGPASLQVAAILRRRDLDARRAHGEVRRAVRDHPLYDGQSAAA